MLRATAAAALFVLLSCGASCADEYGSLFKSCMHPAEEPAAAIKACPALAEMQGIEPTERALFYGNLAIAYQVQGDDNTATGYFDKALKLFPEYWQARAGRVQSDIARTDLDAAVADFELLIKVDPSISDAVKLPGGIHYWSVKNHVADDGTVTKYDDQTPQGSIARLKDRLAHALAYRCSARANTRAFESALGDCTLAYGYDPALLQARGLRGYIEFQQGKFAAALSDLDAVLADNPKASAALYTRGVVKHRMGDAKGGDGDIQAALALDPNVGKGLSAKGVTP
jgi:tetratricopeptide (TPR) repeat protein